MLYQQRQEAAAAAALAGVVVGVVTIGANEGRRSSSAGGEGDGLRLFWSSPSLLSSLPLPPAAVWLTRKDRRLRAEMAAAAREVSGGVRDLLGEPLAVAGSSKRFTRPA